MSFSLWSRTRRVLCCVGLTSAVIAAGIVTTTVTTRGQVLALPGATESTVVTVEPTRVLDTRVPVGLNSKLVAATPQNLQITGSIDTWTEATQTKTSQQVVPTGATGVLMNVTAVSPTASGYLSVRPGNATGVPATAGLNFDPGDIIPNAINIALPTTGEINLYYGTANTGATMDVVIDIVGYTTNTGLIDLVNRVTALENSGVAGPQGPQGEPGPAGVDAESPARVIWVADDNTGDFKSLSAALDSITDATATKPYVIKIAPGVYTENSNVAMKDYVDVEGSGQDITTINCACSNNFEDASAAVISATAITAEIRQLTINNTGGSNDFSYGVYTNSVANESFSMLHVTATATGGADSYGVLNVASSLMMTNVTATATDGDGSYGVYNASSSPTMNNVTATATDSGSNFGVYNNSSSPTMTDVTATATGDGTNSDFSYGVVNNSSSPMMNNVTATATDSSSQNYGVLNLSSSPTMTNVTATATDGVSSYGVNNNSSSPTMNNVTATATDGITFNYGVNNSSSSTSSPSMTNVTATATGGTNNYGVYNTSSSPTMNNVTATSTGGGGGDNYGVYNTSSSPTMNNVTATSTGNTNSAGVYNSSSSPTMTNVTATATDGVDTFGVNNISSSSPTMNNVTATATGGLSNYGVNNRSSSSPTIRNSSITGTTKSIENSESSAKVADSMLDGLVAGDSFTCVGVHNDFVALDENCLALTP